jgi:tetratricopeptide (TPR) repeat protein
VADIQLDIATSIDMICKNENVLWGQFDRNLFGCYFPDTTEESIIDLADQIKKALSTFRKETITIGMAAFPLINYSKEDILDNARKAIDHASFFGPDATVLFDSVTLNISGDIYYQNGDIRGAIEEYTRALLIDHKNINVHNSLGVCYGVTGDFRSALKEFEIAIKLDTHEVMAIYNAGMAHLLMDDNENALAYLLKANDTEQDIFEIPFQTGKLYLKMEQFENAKDYLKKAIDINPNSGTAFRHLGECYMNLYMNSKAIDAFRKAVKLNPNDAASLSAMGYLFEMTDENLEIALMFCKQSIEISPNIGLFRHRLGRIYFKQKKLNNALMEFIKAENLGYDSLDFVEKIQNLQHKNS